MALFTKKDIEYNLVKRKVFDPHFYAITNYITTNLKLSPKNYNYYAVCINIKIVPCATYI